MPTAFAVTKKFTWVTLEGMTKVGATAWAAALDPANGANNEGQGASPPNIGSIDFTNATGGQTDKFRQSTSQTWEDWGVPVGGTVSSVMCPNYWYQQWATTPSYTRKIRVVDSAGTTVHGATDLDNQGPIVQAAGWRRGGSTTAQTVTAGKVASNTVVKLEIEVATAAAGAADIAFSLVEILIMGTTPDVVSTPITQGGVIMEFFR